MERLIEDRRSFLKRASVAAAIPLILGCRDNTSAQRTEMDMLAAIKKNAISDPANSWWGAIDAPETVSSKTRLAVAADQGQRILISGTIFRSDQNTPAPNTLIYLYHTDVHGIYGRSGEHKHGRYRGWMLTDAKGQYEFESIMPASYPDSTIAAHIHMTLTSRDEKEDWVDSILFEGDRFITARERVPQKGGFDPILKLEKKSDGVLRGVRNIKFG